MMIGEEQIELERKEILGQYKELLRHTSEKLNEEQLKFVRKALDVAIDAHDGVRRKSGEPYIYHPIAVARIVAEEIGLGYTSVACGLLHDVVEDSEYSLEDMERIFGKKVSSIIDGLTKISEVLGDDVSLQAENFRKMLLTISEDVRVILIKLADRLHNMRTMDSMPAHKQQKIASETLYIYAPLAHRLGLYSIKSELEDLGLKYTEADSYFFIKNHLKDSKIERQNYIDKFVDPIKDTLGLEDFSFTIKGRPKSIFGIHRKMNIQKVDIDKIFDKFAIRIVIDTPLEKEKADCWKVYSIITDYFRPNPNRLRDWISIPKSNGYESLHTTVMGPEGHWIEIQIRTKRMDEIAEKGLAAHWKYKKNQAEDDHKESTLDDWIEQVKELLENPDQNAINFLDDFKLNLYSKEIYTFSPKGDLITLPKGATALDFAFQIHSNLGATTLGTKVNGSIVPLSHTLENGDQVEIISSKNQKPKENWLNFVFTARAKSKIKSSLSSEKKKIADEGKEILQRKLRSLKLTFDDRNIQKLQSYFKLKTSQDLFYQIGTGQIDNPRLRKFSEETSGNWYKIIRNTISKSGKSTQKMLTGSSVDHTSKILVFGSEQQQLDYHLANCCTPIPGEEVFGFTTVSEGIKVHKLSCPNSQKMMANYAYRILKAEWIDLESLVFACTLTITGLDSVGLVNNITQIISNNMHTDIKSINISGADGAFKGQITVIVKNKIHLDDLIKRLKKIDGISKVTKGEISKA